MLEALGLTVPTIDMKKWETLMENVDNSENVLAIGMVGKYV